MTKRNATATALLEEIEVIEVEAEVIEEVTFSAKEVAAELGLDAKSFRRWLRSVTEERANKGGRWIFTEDAKNEILAKYEADHTKVTTELPLED